MPTDCFDLKTKFAKRYRVVSEDGNNRNTDPWLWQMLCKKGHVYPHGEARLGAATHTKHSVLVHRLLAVPSARLEQIGDDGANVSFDLADFRKVAKIMRPRRRRQLSAEQKAKLAVMGRRFQEEGRGSRQRNDSRIARRILTRLPGRPRHEKPAGDLLWPANATAKPATSAERWRTRQ